MKKILALLGAISSHSLLWFASLSYPAFSVVRMDVSFLGHPDKNPGGWVIWALWIAVQGVIVLLATPNLTMKIASQSPRRGCLGGLLSLAAGVAMLVVAFFPQFKHFGPIHEIGSGIAMGCLYVAVVVWFFALRDDKRVHRFAIAALAFFSAFGPLGFCLTQGYRILAGGLASYRIYGPCPWPLSFSLWEWLLLAGLCTSFVLVMLITPKPSESPSEDPASRSFPIWRKTARTVHLLLLAAGVLIFVELGWYALGRILSPLTAVAIHAVPTVFSPTRRFDGPLKLATYNICHLRGSDANQWPMRDKAGVEKRRDAIVEILKAESPDIVVLEEIDFDSVQTGRINQAEEIGRLAGYPYRVEHRDVDAATLFWFSIRYGNAVLSRYPIISARNINFPASKKWEAILGGTPNGALCEIALSDKIHINVIATHLTSHGEITRVASAKIIEKERLTSKLPFFVVGDLNSTPTGFPNSRSANGENAMDILLAGGGYTARPLNNPAPEDFTIASAVIDWILVPADWRILSKNIARSAASDHYALFLSAACP